MKFRNSYELEFVAFRNYSYVSLITINFLMLAVLHSFFFILYPYMVSPMNNRATMFVLMVSRVAQLCRTGLSGRGDGSYGQGEWAKFLGSGTALRRS